MLYRWAHITLSNTDTVKQAEKDIFGSTPGIVGVELRQVGHLRTHSVTQ